MDGLDAVFVFLVAGFIFTLCYLYAFHLFPNAEGFTNSSTPSSSSISPSTISEVELTIRSALDKYLNADLCSIYKQMRTVLAQSIQGDSSSPTPDTLSKVEATLAKEITLPPLPCPAFTYPTGHSEVEWVNFLNGLPINIGATFVLMAIYAQRELAYRVNNINAALEGRDIISEDKKDDSEKLRIFTKTVLSSLSTEGFESIIGLCPIAAQEARVSSPCSMPQDLTHEEIVQSTNNILKKMEDQKNSILTSMYISPTIDVTPFIQDALKNVKYLKGLISMASEGTLVDHLLASASSTSPTTA
jgi:hypothetical protein